MNQQNYGLIDGFIDGILERFGIDEELINFHTHLSKAFQSKA